MQCPGKEKREGGRGGVEEEEEEGGRGKSLLKRASEPLTDIIELIPILILMRPLILPHEGERVNVPTQGHCVVVLIDE